MFVKLLIGCALPASTQFHGQQLDLCAQVSLKCMISKARPHSHAPWLEVLGRIWLSPADKRFPQRSAFWILYIKFVLNLCLTGFRVDWRVHSWAQSSAIMLLQRNSRLFRHVLLRWWVHDQVIFYCFIGKIYGRHWENAEKSRRPDCDDSARENGARTLRSLVSRRH